MFWENSLYTFLLSNICTLSINKIVILKKVISNVAFPLAKQ